MSKGKQILKNIFSLTVAELAGKGLQAFVILYVAKLLGEIEYSSYTFARNHVALYLMIVTFGMEVFGTREIARNKLQVKTLVNNILSIRLVISIFAYATLAFVAFFVFDSSPNERALILVAGANLFSMGFMLHWVYQGLERMGVFAIRGLIGASLNIVGVLLLVHGPEDSLTAMIVIQSSMIINTIWLLIYYKREFGFPKFVIDKAKWKWILRYSFAIGMAMYIVTIYNIADINMMRMFLGEAHPETGHLGLAHQFVIFGIMPAQIIQMAFFPQLVGKLSSGDKDQILSVFFQLVVITAFFTGGFVAIFPEEISYFFRNEFAEIAPLLQIFAATMFFTFFAILFNTPLMAWGKEKLCLIGNLGGLLANISLNAFLIPRYGMYGAAFATISSEVAVMIILGYFFRKQTGRFYFDKLHIWILVAACSLLPAYAIKHFLNMPIIAIITSFILFIVMNFVFKTIKLNQVKSYLKIK